ncbi:SUKH-4 family immunity protein [Streptomyces sp. A5-4]|uniref:SUKH-4 family immunity protein n=1 Tax=Streptomyces sp. A5-4 TaxID=3384771 RepID=UPI003DA825AB
MSTQGTRGTQGNRGTYDRGDERELDALLADPDALLHADRDDIRGRLSSDARPTAPAEDGRAVFRQAEAIFGTEDVPRAEFASWLHFAAAVLDRTAYAERIMAAEPDMPWSTEWTWWRPVGHHRAHPNLSGDCGTDQLLYRGRPLIQVDGQWCDDRWFDLRTGEPVPAPPEDEIREYSPGRDAEAVLPVLFDTDAAAPALSVPPTWEYAEPLDAEGRYLIEEARGIAVLRINSEALEGWPTGGASYESAEEGGVDLDPSPDLDPPLTAARMDEAFDADGVLRFPDRDLPAALEHRPTRVFLAEVGIPVWWAGGVTVFNAARTIEPLAKDPELLSIGTFELRPGEDGEVCVHRATGVVHLRHSGAYGAEADRPDPVFYFARDVETFTLFLENMRRYMGASWDPYEEETGAEFEYEDRMEDLDPRALAAEAPSREVWKHIFATITELSVYGY